jgi:small subunit ribosomal protein S20
VASLLNQEKTDVANSLSAKKRIRQNAKRRARNRARKDTIKDQVKSFTAAIVTGDFKKAGDALKDAVKRMDRVAGKGTIHKNTAARKRSRLTKRLNAAMAAAKNKPADAPQSKRGGRAKAKATGKGESA